MPRPRKPPGERKNYHLRVPLSDAQHALIEEPAGLTGPAHPLRRRRRAGAEQPHHLPGQDAQPQCRLARRQYLVVRHRYALQGPLMTDDTVTRAAIRRPTPKTRLLMLSLGRHTACAI